MTTVTAMTAARMQSIEDNAVVGGAVVVNDLILTKHNGTTVNAGNVRGPQGNQGIQGIQGPTGFVAVANQAARLALTGVPVGQTAYEQDTERVWRWNGTAWKWVVGTGSSPYLAEVYRNAAYSIPTTMAVLPFDSETTDRSNAHSAGLYTAPVTARYRVTTAILAQIATSGATPLIGAAINGAETKRLDQVQPRGITAGDYYMLNGSVELGLTAGQTLSIYSLAGGSATPILPGAAFSWATFDLVGY